MNAQPDQERDDLLRRLADAARRSTGRTAGDQPEQLTLDEEVESFHDFMLRTRTEYLDGRDTGDETEEEAPPQ